MTAAIDRDARIALLIDADNSPAGKIDVILAELAKFGVANIRRAYGNWKKQELRGWEEVLHEYAIRPIQQFDYSKGKNATDMSYGDRCAGPALHRPARRLRHRLERRRLHAAGHAPASQGRAGLRLRREEDADAVRQCLLAVPLPRKPGPAGGNAADAAAGNGKPTAAKRKPRKCGAEAAVDAAVAPAGASPRKP